MKHLSKWQAAMCLVVVTAIYLTDIFVLKNDTQLFYYGTGLYVVTAVVIVAYILGLVRPR